jgi:5-methylcytosine-specific restriction protein A
MPSQPPVFRMPGAGTARKAWARPGSPFASNEDRRIRGRAGQKLRRQVLSEEPLCRVCLEQRLTAASAIADHIVPLAWGGAPGRENMQGLCEPCSDAKTKRESVAGADRWRRGAGSRGAGSNL